VTSQEFVSKIKAKHGGKVLATGQFGKRGMSLIFIESTALTEISTACRAEYDFLENLSVAELDGALLITYFLTTTQDRRRRLAIRTTVDAKDSEKLVEIQSVHLIWPEVTQLERELRALWGVKVIGLDGREERVLPEGWQGFPLRKGYVFPMEFGGMPHSRPIGKSFPDEFEAPT
jgi:Ni,Fe-hydrogenase III component G